MNGRTVPEREVELFLSKYFKLQYEQPVFLLDLENRPRVYSPDFYLPQLGLYIEVCGAERDYEYRKKVYTKNHVPIIFVEIWKYKTFQWQKYIFVCIVEKQKERQKLLDAFTKK